MLQSNFSSSPGQIPHESLFFDVYTQKFLPLFPPTCPQYYG